MGKPGFPVLLGNTSSSSYMAGIGSGWLVWRVMPSPVLSLTLTLVLHPICFLVYVTSLVPAVKFSPQGLVMNVFPVLPSCPSLLNHGKTLPESSIVFSLCLPEQFKGHIMNWGRKTCSEAFPLWCNRILLWWHWITSVSACLGLRFDAQLSILGEESGCATAAVSFTTATWIRSLAGELHMLWGSKEDKKQENVLREDGLLRWSMQVPANIIGGERSLLFFTPSGLQSSSSWPDRFPITCLQKIKAPPSFVSLIQIASRTLSGLAICLKWFLHSLAPIMLCMCG